MVMSINGSKRGRECTSLNYNFHAWYELVIRFSDNPRQKGAIDGIVLTHENKARNLQIRYHFSRTHMVQLTVSKICQRDIRSTNSNFMPCQEAKK